VSATPIAALARYIPEERVDDAVQLLDERGLGQLALHAGEVRSILDEAKAITTIASRADEAKASELISRGEVVLKELDELRRSFTDPLNDQVKAVNALFKLIADPCVAETGKRGPLETRIMAFRSAEKARLAREAAEAQRKQEEAAKRLADAEAKAAAAKTPAARAKALEVAQVASQEQMHAAADESFARGAAATRGVKTDSGSVTERQRWVLQGVHDYDLVPPSYWETPEVRESLHRVLQRAITGGLREIPGCSIGLEESLTRRTG